MILKPTTIYVDLNGDVLQQSRTSIYRYSDINEIRLVTPLAVQGGMRVNFLLSNGVTIEQKTMTALTEKETVNGEEWNVWSYRPTNVITATLTAKSVVSLQLSFTQITIVEGKTFGNTFGTVTLSINPTIEGPEPTLEDATALDELQSDITALTTALGTKVDEDLTGYSTLSVVDEDQTFVYVYYNGGSYKVSLQQWINLINDQFAGLNGRLVTLEGRVNQDVRNSASPTFVATTIGGTSLTSTKIISYDDHIAITDGNPHGVDKADLGLSNVDNTSDADKGISTATQTALNEKVDTSALGVTVATLQSGKVPANQLPSFVEDVLEYADFDALVANADGKGEEKGKIYVTKDNGKIYRWSGSQYIEISASDVNGVKGDNESTFRTGNVNITKANIGLGNVADIAQVTDVTGTAPIVSSGGTTPAISIDEATQSVKGAMSAADKTKLDGIATSANNYTHPNHSGDVTSVGDGATTIAEKAVTLDKMADLSENSIIGNDTGSAGVPKALTASEVRTLINVADGAQVNVDTNLSITNKTTTTLDVASSTGTDATIPAATVTEAGLLVSSDKEKIDYLTVTENTNLDDIRNRIGELSSAVVLRGTWDPTTNEFPGGGTAIAGDSYIVIGTAVVDGIQFTQGDRIVALVNNASTTVYANNWLKQDYTDKVSSVNTQTGAVTIDAESVGLGNVTNEAQITAVSGTAPIVSSGGTTPAISITEATDEVAGAMSASDKAKLDALTAATLDTVTTDFDGILSATEDTVQKALDVLDDIDASDVPFDNDGLNLVATDVQEALVEIDGLVEEGLTLISLQAFTITNVGSNPDLFSYTVGSTTVTDKPYTGNSFEFELINGVEYITGANRLIVKVNKDITLFSQDPALTEVSDTKFSVELSGKLEVNDIVYARVYQSLATVTIDIADASVTEQKIAGSAVTEAKIASNAVTESKIANDAVTTNKIANNNVTLAKVEQIATKTILGNDTEDTANVKPLTVAETKELLALNNVTNTSDANKPVSTLQQVEFDKVNNATEFVTATNTTSSDFITTLTNGLTTNAIVTVKFPTADDDTQQARLSIDGGTSYFVIQNSAETDLLGSAVENKTLSLVHNTGTSRFITLEPQEITYSNQTALDGKQATITGAATTITSADLTADKALISDAQGKVAVSTVTATEVGHLAGVTSGIQSQIDGLALGDTNVIEEVQAEGVALTVTAKSVNVTRASLGAAQVDFYSTTIAAADTWTDQTGFFTLAKTVNGLLATDNPIVDLNLATATVGNIEDIQTAWSNIYRVVATTNTITFYALEEPVFPEDTVIQIKVVR